MNIIAVIPARGGSKKIKNKNILKINKKPLIYYSIKVSKKITKIKNTYVSTDSEKIKKISTYYGAKAPFLRPKKISKDRSTDLEFMKHFCMWYKKEKKIPIDLLIHLRPTTPFRNPKTINKAIDLMIKNRKYSSLRSFIVSDFSGYKLLGSKFTTLQMSISLDLIAFNKYLFLMSEFSSKLLIMSDNL